MSGWQIALASVGAFYALAFVLVLVTRLRIAAERSREAREMRRLVREVNR